MGNGLVKGPGSLPLGKNEYKKSYPGHEQARNDEHTAADEDDEGNEAETSFGTIPNNTNRFF